MKLLEDAIIRRGHVKNGDVLKVDEFLNHQMDVPFINKLGGEFFRLFKESSVNKILTIEASGIGIACITAQHFGVPVVFAKKAESLNIDGEVYTSRVRSFTKQREYDVIVSKRFLGPEDRVLIIDDFLARGSALLGLLDVVKQSGATLIGAGICIEKGFDTGGKLVRDLGVRVESLAVIKEMGNGKIIFAD